MDESYSAHQLTVFLCAILQLQLQFLSTQILYIVWNTIKFVIGFEHVNFATLGGYHPIHPAKQRGRILVAFSGAARISAFFWGGGPGSMGKSKNFSLEKSKISHFFKLENFQKMLKNQ